MIVVWTDHAKARQQEWFTNRAITRSDVEATVRDPEQMVPGHSDLKVAQSRLLGGLLRVPFLEVEGMRLIVTCYWTSELKRYWRPGNANTP